MSFEQMQAYDDKLVTLLETLWGEGYLSPGGDEETARVLDGIELNGKRVLDIGCGTGGCAFFIAGQGAARVTGIDVEPTVIKEAHRQAGVRGLSDRVRFEVVTPGPLTLAYHSIDVVFSKDAIVHVPDKAAIFAEVFRVLAPGGQLAISDWMLGADGPMSDDLKDYIEAEGLGFACASPDRYFAALSGAGFERISYLDRTDWYRDLTHKELAALRGPLYPVLEKKVGREFLDHEIVVWERLVRVLETAELGPGHWRALKP